MKVEERGGGGGRKGLEGVVRDRETGEWKEGEREGEVGEGEGRDRERQRQRDRQRERETETETESIGFQRSLKESLVCT